MFDTAILGGTLIDGTGSKAYKADIYISKGKISYIDKDSSCFEADETINASDLIVTPGFIDIHTHEDICFTQDPFNTPKLTQGVTTVIVGNCGMGVAVAPENAEALYEFEIPVLGPEKRNLTKSIPEYLRSLENTHPAMNVGVLAGHIPMRVAVSGFTGRVLDNMEMKKLTMLAEHVLEEGCLGISTGLQYQPAYHANKEELVALGGVISRFNGIFPFHMRDLSENVIGALNEVIDISRLSGAKVQVSHLRVYGKSNYGKMKEALLIIDQANGAGIDIGFDNYPYTAGSTMLSMVLPQWLVENGVQKALELLEKEEYCIKAINDMERPESITKMAGAQNIIILGVKTDSNKKYEGKRLSAITENSGLQPETMLLKLFKEEEGNVTICAEWFSQQDVDDVIEHPSCIVVSDSIHTEGKPHPRLYGTYPRFIRQYYGKDKITLEEAIRKITSAPADRMALKGRGVIKEGYQADITIFNQSNLSDTATYEEPKSFSNGIIHVLVNGELTLSNGKTTGYRAGKILTR